MQKKAHIVKKVDKNLKKVKICLPYFNGLYLSNMNLPVCSWDLLNNITKNEPTLLQKETSLISMHKKHVDE